MIVVQLQLSTFSPHPSAPPQPNPPPSPASTLPLGFVHVCFIVVPANPSPCYPFPPSPALVRLFLTSMTLVIFCLLFNFIFLSEISQVVRNKYQLSLLNSRSLLGSTQILFPCVLAEKFSQDSELSNHSTYLTCLLSVMDCRPTVSEVQCLENPFHIFSEVFFSVVSGSIINPFLPHPEVYYRSFNI